MSPRPTASRHDATARKFLNTAARLIDASLTTDLAARAATPGLKSIHFPAALDWLRVEDVIRLAGSHGSEGVSRKAFFNRWPVREEFLKDALVYALLYQDGTPDTAAQIGVLLAPSGKPISVRVAEAADGMLAFPHEVPA